VINPLHDDLARIKMPDFFKKLFRSSSKTRGSTSAKNTPSVTPRASTSHTGSDSAVNLDLIASPIIEGYQIGAPGERKQRCIEYGITALEILKEITEANGVLSPLKAVCGVTLAILNTIKVRFLLLLVTNPHRYIQAVDNNKDAWKQVLDTIHKHRNVFKEQLDSTNVQEIRQDLHPKLLAAIQIYAR
jgi:hypothetical protein